MTIKHYTPDVGHGVSKAEFVVALRREVQRLRADEQHLKDEAVRWRLYAQLVDRQAHAAMIGVGAVGVIVSVCLSLALLWR